MWYTGGTEAMIGESINEKNFRAAHGVVDIYFRLGVRGVQNRRGKLRIRRDDLAHPAPRIKLDEVRSRRQHRQRELRKRLRRIQRHKEDGQGHLARRRL